MPYIDTASIRQYYTREGSGERLVFVHGAFVDSRMWDVQAEYFSHHFEVIRYDLRGHGNTGSTEEKDYSISLFSDDLAALLDSLDVKKAHVCGLSLGGMIAQEFVISHPSRVDKLILADTAVSVELTMSDKFQRYILFPKWMMDLAIRAMGVRQFVEFSFWLAKVTRTGEWFGRDLQTSEYVRECMLGMTEEEYLKTYDAIYGFKLLDLNSIRCPVLVMNGEHESKSVFRHTEEIIQRVPDSRAVIVEGAGHTSNMENPALFNRYLADFLRL